MVAEWMMGAMAQQETVMAISVMKTQVMESADIAVKGMADHQKIFELPQGMKGPCTAKRLIPQQCPPLEPEVLSEDVCLRGASEEGALLEGTLMDEVKILQFRYHRGE